MAPKYKTIIAQPSQVLASPYDGHIIGLALAHGPTTDSAETVQLRVGGLDHFISPVPCYLLPSAQGLRDVVAQQSLHAADLPELEPVPIKPGAPIVVEATQPIELLLALRDELCVATR